MDARKDEIAVLNATQLIQRKPTMFFREGKARAEELLALVLTDVAGVMAESQARVRQQGPFHLVTADVDWLDTTLASVPELFERFVPPTPRRMNSHRAEVLLNAVCKGVLSIGPAGNYSRALGLEDLPDSLASEARTAKRFLAWEL